MKTIADVRFYSNQAVIDAPELFNMTDGEYVVTIEPKAKKRTLDQNRYFWKLVGEISKKENGDLRSKDTVYVNLLQMSGAKYVSHIMRHDAFEDWLKINEGMHAKIVNQQMVNHQLYDTVYTFYGSSTFNTSEMSQLIETALNYAAEVGVENVDGYWRKLLND